MCRCQICFDEAAGGGKKGSQISIAQGDVGCKRKRSFAYAQRSINAPQEEEEEEEEEA